MEEEEEEVEEVTISLQNIHATFQNLLNAFVAIHVCLDVP